VLVTAACADGTTAQEASKRRTADGLASMVVPECDDTGSCIAGFYVDGDFYSQSCAAVRTDLVSERPFAKGRYGDTSSVEMRAVRGVDSDVLAAISGPGGACEEGEVPTSPWSMAFGPGAEDERVRDDAICMAITEADRARNGCA
jgi:hypothetical protein